MSKKISIITICYNAPNTEQTCRSIINQTFQDFEWIVIDGGSNQETLDIFEKYKSHMDYFVSEKDNGIYNAMNKGIKRASGDYLLFMNAGDSLYDKNVLKKFVSAGLDADIIYGHRYIKEYDKECTVPDTIDTNFLILDTLPHQGTLIKRDLFEKYGMYDENLKIVSDWKKWVEFIHIHKCSYKHIPFRACYFDVNGASGENRWQKEKSYIVSQMFTKQQIHHAFNSQLSLIQKIFSINNFMFFDKKVITIFGFHILFNKQGKKQ